MVKTRAPRPALAPVSPRSAGSGGPGSEGTGSPRARRARAAPAALIGLGLLFVAACGSSDFGPASGSVQLALGVVQGVVRDVGAPGTPPLEGILVELNPGVETDVTDVNGFYQFRNVPAGTYKVTAFRPGNRSNHAADLDVTVAGGAVTEANIDFGFAPPVENSQQVLFLSSNEVANILFSAHTGTDVTRVSLAVPPPVVEARFNRADPGEFIVETAPSGNSGIFLNNPTTGSFSTVRQTSAPEVHPDLSPDGQRAVYAADTDGDGNFEIFLINRDGTSPTLLVDDFDPLLGADFDNRDPAWSPDGVTILFVSRRTDVGATIPERDYEVSSVRAEGGPVLQLTDDLLEDRDPAWHPDSTTIVYAKQASGFFQLFLSTAQQFTPEVQLTSSFTDDRDPTVSFDGEFVSWVTRENIDGTNPDLSREVAVARLVGTQLLERRLLTQNPASVALSSPDYRPGIP